MEKLTQNTNNLTVLILAAGFGRRMGPFSRMINKSLVPYDNKPLLSHIIEKFPVDTNFVIACGNMGQQIKDYVSTVHAEKNVDFVDIPDFDEISTGPATTIRYCSSRLPEKFFWISCDTLFDFTYHNKLDHNWIAVHPVDSNISKDYCWIRRDGDNVIEVNNKISSKSAVDAFIGLMYVNDIRFIENLEQTKARDVYEGFKGIDLKAYTVSEWQDFGTYEKWDAFNELLPEVSFPKPDEIFYSDNSKIIKFTTDVNLARLKFNRAQLNPACCPEDVSFTGNFLFYKREDGDTLYNSLTKETFVKFLNWAEEKLWIQTPPPKNSKEIADTFYRKKTLERLAKFRVKHSSWAEFSLVNDRSVKTINEYISDIDFEELSYDTKWCYIHGDLQFDNIIYNKFKDRFTIIDWRTEFAGDLYGDLYYDLAKMLGGIYLSYKLIKEDKFSYVEEGNAVRLSIPSVDDYNWYVDTLRRWVMSRNLNWKKVRTLVPIIYLNMSPLHDEPFDKFLFSLSQYCFSNI